MTTEKFVLKSWPDRDVATLKQMWWDGASADEIRMAINAKSTKAVREKIARMEFKRNPEIKPRRGMPSIHEMPHLLLPAMRPDGSLVTVATVKDGKECKWIEASDELVDAPMCGRASTGPWCELHMRRAFTRAAA